MKRKRLLLLLALLITAATGAWAQTSDKATPLTLQATADGWISISDPKVGMKYKVGNDEKQTVTGTDYVTIDVNEGQTVQFFGNGTEITAYGVEQGSNYTQFNSSVKCYIYGNIMSLVDETGFAKATELTGDYAFQLLFSGFRNLSNHPSRKLVLPAMTMTKECYYGMFFGSGLTEAPALPAQKLAERCYKNMFYGCSSLTAAPELPATTLKKQCYYGMFQNCTSLTTAPLLPAPELAQQCYNWMFYGCTNLNAVTCLATDISAEYATYGWLNDVAATGTLTIAKGTEDKWAAKSTDEGIPSGWTTDLYGYKVKLADGTADAANWSATVNGEQPNPLPVGGLGNGDDVTLNYSGHLKVKSVTATTDAANTYLMWDAAKKELVEAEIPETVTKVTNADDYVTWAAGTYLVEGNVTINGEVKLSGDVELIIKDGAKLTANYIFGDNNNLNIYGQANKSGELNVACSGSDAIVNLTVLNIHSCKVNASSSLNDCGAFYGIGEFNVYGGSVDAKYTGDSNGYGLCDISSLNIWGGEMKAEGKGAGSYSYGITIFGGATNVTVYGGKLWVKSADLKALDPDDDVTFTKDPSYTTGVIETSDDGTEWTPYTDAGKPNTKYVRVGY